MKTEVKTTQRPSYKTLAVLCVSKVPGGFKSMHQVFLGDYIAKEATLPKMKANDFIVMHDTGGYTHALYSR